VSSKLKIVRAPEFREIKIACDILLNSSVLNSMDLKLLSKKRSLERKDFGAAYNIYRCVKLKFLATKFAECVFVEK
jgi:hypothetical protein